MMCGVQLPLVPLARPVAALALAALALGGCGDAEGPAAERSGERRSDDPDVGRGTVTRVVDGDTIRVRLADGGEERVRLLGIDAPEVSTTRTGRPECGGRQARAAAQRLADRSADVLLLPDAATGGRDQYGRLLAYVVPAAGGVSWQEELLGEGWVQVYLRPDQAIGRIDQFRAAAAAARRERAGVWERCGGSFRRPQ